MWNEFFHNMDLLAQGIDENGNPLYVDSEGNKWCGVLLFGLGDLEQLCVAYGMPAWGDADQICGWCDANRTDRKYTNLQHDAEWRPSENMSNDVSGTNALAAQSICLIILLFPTLQLRT